MSFTFYLNINAKDKNILKKKKKDLQEPQLLTNFIFTLENHSVLQTKMLLSSFIRAWQMA